MSNSIIRLIKQELANTLLADPYFANIPIMPIVANDVMSQLQAGQYRANGLTIFIDWLSLHNSDPVTPGPWFNQGMFTAEVYEIPAMNVSGPDVDEVAENVANTLQLAMVESQNSAVIEGITKLDNDEFGNNLRIIRITYPFGFKPRILPSISPVTISPLTQGNQLVTLSCMTPGAAIFYTEDGTYPAPRNPTAKLAIIQSSGYLLAEDGSILYAENGQPLLSENGVVNYAFQVAAGTLLKARAWLAGYTSAIPDFTQFQF